MGVKTSLYFVFVALALSACSITRPSLLSIISNKSGCEISEDYEREYRLAAQSRDTQRLLKLGRAHGLGLTYGANECRQTIKELAAHYMMGVIVKRDVEEAEKLLSRFDYDDMGELGAPSTTIYRLRQGLFVFDVFSERSRREIKPIFYKDSDKKIVRGGMGWLKQAAEEGNIKAAETLAEVYKGGHFSSVEKDRAMIEKWKIVAEENKVAESNRRVAEGDFENAIAFAPSRLKPSLALKGFQQGDAFSAGYLARGHYYGKFGFDLDKEKGLMYAEKSIEFSGGYGFTGSGSVNRLLAARLKERRFSKAEDKFRRLASYKKEIGMQVCSADNAMGFVERIAPPRVAVAVRNRASKVSSCAGCYGKQHPDDYYLFLGKKSVRFNDVEDYVWSHSREWAPCSYN